MDFRFQKDRSTDHTIIVHLVDQIYETFENDNYTLGYSQIYPKHLIDGDHSILLKNQKCTV